MCEGELCFQALDALSALLQGRGWAQLEWLRLPKKSHKIINSERPIPALTAVFPANCDCGFWLWSGQEGTSETGPGWRPGPGWRDRLDPWSISQELWTSNAQLVGGLRFRV